MLKYIANAGCFFICTFVSGVAYSAEPFDLSLKINFSEQDDGYQFRRENEKQVKSLMLFGVLNDDTAVQAVRKPYTVGKKLENFLNQHIENAKNGLERSVVSESTDVYTGQTSFLSEKFNKGIDVKPAKLAGFSIDFGKMKIGGGYTWGEKNPALLNGNKKGMIFGASYGVHNWEFQTSVLTGGTNPYNFASDVGDASVMMGATWMRSDKRGYTATIQYQKDDAVMLTVGTKYKF